MTEVNEHWHLVPGEVGIYDMVAMLTDMDVRDLTHSAKNAIVFYDRNAYLSGTITLSDKPHEIVAMFYINPRTGETYVEVISPHDGD